jgi:hypothetical protein
MLAKSWLAAILTGMAVFGLSTARAEHDCCCCPAACSTCPSCSTAKPCPGPACAESGCPPCCSGCVKKVIESCCGECCSSCCKDKKKSAATKAHGNHPLVIVVAVPMAPVCGAFPPGPVCTLPQPGMMAPPMPAQVLPCPPFERMGVNFNYPPPFCHGPVPCPPPCPVDEAKLDCTDCLSVMLGLAADLVSIHAESHLSQVSTFLSLVGMAADLLGQACDAGLTSQPPSVVPQPPQMPPPPPPCPLLSRPPTSARVCAPESLPCPTAEPVVPCCRVPAPTAAVAAAYETCLRVAAAKDGDCLEISVGASSLTCKKMDVKLPDGSVHLSIVSGKVRVRTADLKATAERIITDQKEKLILDGDVYLHYCKDGQCTAVSADHIEVNLADGRLQVNGAGKSKSY